MRYYNLQILTKNITVLFITLSMITSCKQSNKTIETKIIEPTSIIGTWKLLTGTIIEGKDTVVTDYTINQELIKIINDTHFAFLRHDLKKDSNSVFVSGGGRCQLDKNKYTEHLDFCNFREWENNTFDLEFEVIGDTLTTRGVEKVESLNINRYNVEKYVRLKKN